MSGEVIKLYGDDHEEVELLLPWYVTGRLDPADQARVEGHLAICPECAAEIRSERALARGVAELPVDVGQGWASLRSRVEREAGDQRVKGLGGWRDALRLGAERNSRAAPRWVGWAIAAQVAVLAVGGLLIRAPAPQPGYHALGAAPADRAANAMVIFRPEMTEARMRRLLERIHARLVDGPTAADAYVLHLPPVERAAGLKALRSDPDIEVAEPIDAAAPS
jgi:anti-sigma factor RsiW